MRHGSIDVTSTYRRKSNLRPLIRNGLWMYLLMMQFSSIGTSEISFICHAGLKKLVTYDVDSFALARVLGLDDPIIGLVSALEPVKVTVKVGKLIR